MVRRKGRWGKEKVEVSCYGKAPVRPFGCVPEAVLSACKAKQSLSGQSVPSSRSSQPAHGRNAPCWFSCVAFLPLCNFGVSPSNRCVMVTGFWIEHVRSSYPPSARVAKRIQKRFGSVIDQAESPNQTKGDKRKGPFVQLHANFCSLSLLHHLLDVSSIAHPSIATRQAVRCQPSPCKTRTLLNGLDVM